MAKVLNAKVSPLNPKQWNLSLDCGHYVWVTAKRKPTRKSIKCERCKTKEQP
jgi:hypothetical protein